MKILLLLLIPFTMDAQSVKLLTSGTKTSIRGLSAVNDKVVCVSGSGGMIGRSIDAGGTWKWVQATSWLSILCRVYQEENLDLMRVKWG